MDPKSEKLSFAIENIDPIYLEEALEFEPEKLISFRRKSTHPLRLSAACVALLILFGLSAAAFAVSRIPLSWRDIFSGNQTVIDDGDEAPVVSEPVTDPGSETAAYPEVFTVNIEKVLSDERMMYLLYSLKANEGAVLDPDGRFASFSNYYTGKMMSGVYVQYFLDRRASVPENELEGVVISYAPRQPSGNSGKLVLSFSDWQEKGFFGEPKVDIDLAEIVSAAGEHAAVPNPDSKKHPYLWQPGDWDVPLPCGGISVCNAGWENGILQIVMKAPDESTELTIGENWYLKDTRTGEIFEPEWGDTLRSRLDFEPDLDWKDCTWSYHWGFVSVDKDALPYLEMYWGEKSRYTTVLSGEWKAQITEIPQTIHSKLLAENASLSYEGRELLAERIECSKLSMALYFRDYVDSANGILSKFTAYDAAGNQIDCSWGFMADQNDDSCMIWTYFNEPIDPETICRLTFCGKTIFEK